MQHGEAANPEVNVPSRVVDRRMRNRMMEYLDFAATADEELGVRYSVNILNEIFNQFEDYFADLPETYSSEEKRAIEQYRVVWGSACDDVPDYARLADIAHIASRNAMRAAASAIFEIFERGGRRSEEVTEE